MPAFARCQESQGVSWGVPDLCLMLLLPSRAHCPSSVPPTKSTGDILARSPQGLQGNGVQTRLLMEMGFQKAHSCEAQRTCPFDHGRPHLGDGGQRGVWGRTGLSAWRPGFGGYVGEHLSRWITGR